jgi:hypothetical protein
MSKSKSRAAEFYTLPASKLRAGMSTADGQDVVSVDASDPTFITYHVVTPGYADGETRGSLPNGTIRLAVFTDTEVDGRESPKE